MADPIEGQALGSRKFYCSRAKKSSIAALSPAAPTRPMDATTSCRLMAWTNFLDRNWDPRPEWMTQPATSPRRATRIVDQY